MKRNDLNEIKNANADAIEAKVAAAKKELSSLIIDKNMNKLSDLKSLSKKRRDIAQMMTVLNQKLELDKLEKNLKDIKEGKTE